MSEMDDPLNQEPDFFKEAKAGQSADRLLNDEAFKKGMAGMNEATIDAIRSCPIGSQERLNYLHLMLKVIGDFESNLRQVIETGNLALAQLRVDEEKAEFKREKAATLGIPVNDLKEYR